MNSKIIINAEKSGTSFYPALMKSKGMVVLFTADGCGTVVYSADASELGKYSCNWNMRVFDFENDLSVELSN